ncbi:MAG: hypothetical protein BLITH_1374 [Brockia lithotrophica]|uniref:Uncharacterized protein n=1 Tax=Brockia lithotrophica TaxID=933949 RepID=A0A2T5G6B6_9BACL|nr:MAG: hypothetical protein BLITH_1374 [Brockia lithotrophica]
MRTLPLLIASGEISERPFHPHGLFRFASPHPRSYRTVRYKPAFR